MKRHSNFPSSLFVYFPVDPIRFCTYAGLRGGGYLSGARRRIIRKTRVRVFNTKIVLTLLITSNCVNRPIPRARNETK